MKNQELISVLKRTLEENEDLTPKEEQAIRDYLQKAHNNQVTTQDIVDLAKSLLGIVELLKSLLE